MGEPTKRQIGKCGELLVQYTLLKKGVDSAHLTTDPGIDLIAFPSVREKPVTIQVKTSRLHSDYAGDKYLRWQIPETCPADYIAMVDFHRDKCWLIETEKFKRKAHHTRDNQRRLHLYLSAREPESLKRQEEEFTEYEMGNAIPKVFGLE